MHRNTPSKAKEEESNGTAAAAPAPGGKKGSSRPPSKAVLERRRLEAYRVPALAEAGPWQQVASNLEELEELGLKLRRSKKLPDPTMAATVGGWVGGAAVMAGRWLSHVATEPCGG